ncbi:MAG: DinB family protein [Planctomycetes bacterium]|nr:DinB family protein [Planctomycetota bacterium]
MPSELMSAALQRLDEADARARQLVEPLTNEQANWKPSAKSWSVNECLEHLCNSLSSYASKMKPAIERAKAGGRLGGEPYAKGTVIGRYIIRELRKPPGTSRAPAPRVFKPARSDYVKSDQLKTFLEHTQRVREFAAQAEGLALGSIRFGTPVSALIRVSLAQAFEIHGWHNLRHVAQIERVIKRENFPKA